MRITTKKGRDFAFKLRAIRNERTGKKRWFVGITTKEYFWLDLDVEFFKTAELLAYNLRAKLKTTVYIFKTTKSFWLVTKKKLSPEEWDEEYERWLNFPKGLVCYPFCKCCIRYHKATLRVSAKKGKRPKLVKVINRLEGGQGDIIPPAPRLRDFPKSQRAEALPVVHTLRQYISPLVDSLRKAGFLRGIVQGGQPCSPFMRPHFEI